MDNSRLSAIALGVTVFFGMGADTATAAQRGSYDGPWSVVIVTERGSCGAFGIPFQITRGRVGPRGSADFAVSGRVSPNGIVSVSVRRGEQSASGRGRLAGRRGSGVWRGSECSGSWTAAKAY